MASIHVSANAAVDFQLHTVLSDGTWTPEDLIDHLIREGFALAAITDHDRVDTLVSLQELAQARNFNLLVAAEMSTQWRDGFVDVLCFGFDPHMNALQPLTETFLRDQQNNLRQTAANMAAQGFVLNDAALQTVLDKPVVQQPHAFVEIVRQHGFHSTERSAGRLAVDCGLQQLTMEIHAVVDAVHRSSGVCLIAHPGRGDGYIQFDESLLDQLRAEVPIDGLEVLYPEHSPELTTFYREYADKHGLLTSAGSDSHKPTEPPVKYPVIECRSLLERLGIGIQGPVNIA